MEDLLHALGASFSGDDAARSEAEEYLTSMLAEPDYFPMLLRITLDVERHELHHRQAAAIQFKNVVLFHWANEGISSDDRVAVMEYVVEGYLGEEVPLVGVQLRTAIAGLFAHCCAPPGDKEDKWPAFLPGLLESLTSEEGARLQRTLELVEAICDALQNHTRDAAMPDWWADNILSLLLPYLPDLVMSDDPAAASLLLPAMASYYFLTRYRMPPSLLEEDSILPWTEALVGVLTRELPADQVPEDEYARAECPWWRLREQCMKTAYTIFNRYGNVRYAPKDLKDWAHHYSSTIGLQLTELVRDMMLGELNGVYMSPPTRVWAVQLIDTAVEAEASWPLVREHLNDIIFAYCVPFMAYDADEADHWADDTIDFMRSGWMEEFHDGHIKTVTLQLLRTLVARRPNVAVDMLLPGMLSWLEEELNKPPEAQDPLMQEGVCMLSAATAQGLLDNVEDVSPIEQLVFSSLMPLTESPAPFVRAAACTALCRYVEVDYSEEGASEHVCSAVLALVSDADIAVRYTAVVNSRLFMRLDLAQELIVDQLGPMLEAIFEITQLVGQSDMLNTALETLISYHAEELAPHAVQVCRGLLETFQGLVQMEEMDELQQETAFNCLFTISTLLDVTRYVPYFDELREMIVPVLLETLRTEDIAMLFVEDVMQITTYFVAYRLDDGVHDGVWAIYETVVNAVLGDLGYSYADQVLAVTGGLLKACPADLLGSGSLMESLMRIATEPLMMEEMGGSEVIASCTLQYTFFLLTEAAALEEYLPRMLEATLAQVEQGFVLAELGMQLTSALACALYHNPYGVIAYGESTGTMEMIVNVLSQGVEFLSTPLSYKMVCLGISSLFTVPASDVPEAVMASLVDLVGAVMHVLHDKEVHIQEMEAKRKFVLDFKAAQLEEEEEEAERLAAADGGDAVDEDEEYLRALEALQASASQAADVFEMEMELIKEGMLETAGDDIVPVGGTPDDAEDANKSPIDHIDESVFLFQVLVRDAVWDLDMLMSSLPPKLAEQLNEHLELGQRRLEAEEGGEEEG